MALRWYGKGAFDGRHNPEDLCAYSQRLCSGCRRDRIKFSNFERQMLLLLLK